MTKEILKSFNGHELLAELVRMCFSGGRTLENMFYCIFFYQMNALNMFIFESLVVVISHRDLS